MSKLNKHTFFVFFVSNPNPDFKGQHSFIPFRIVYMWRTLPPSASNSVLGPYFPMYYHLVIIVNINIDIYTRVIIVYSPK